VAVEGTVIVVGNGVAVEGTAVAVTGIAAVTVAVAGRGVGETAVSGVHPINNAATVSKKMNVALKIKGLCLILNFLYG
jgi:hypothetical protein